MKKKGVGAKAAKLSKPEVDFPGIAEALTDQGRGRDVMEKAFLVLVS